MGMALPLPPRLQILLRRAALDMLGDQHVTVEDPHKMLGGDGLHGSPASTIGTRYRNPPKEIKPCRSTQRCTPAAARSGCRLRHRPRRD
jgi:hypothetical protein